MDASRFKTATLRRRPDGDAIAVILAAAVAAADPYGATARHLAFEGDAPGEHLRIGSTRYPLNAVRRIFVLAVGKAAVPMARAALDLLRERATHGLVIPKADGDDIPLVGAFEVVPAAHPVPDARSVRAGERALALVRDADEHDLVLVLLSGGGSALMTAPRPGLTLDDMRDVTSALLASGATIDEVNALRRRLDGVKGGGLLRAASPARVAVLVLSDVLGDDLLAIASGPFVAQPEHTDARAVVARYGLQLSPQVIAMLDTPPEPFDAALAGRVEHTIVANVHAALEGASVAARDQGFVVEVIDTAVRGEASAVGAALAHRLLDATRAGPFCLLAGGETTVTLRGNGRGGRNQELALSAVRALSGRDDVVLVALATDGGDGPTDAAGSVVDGTTLRRGEALGLDVDDALRRNDAYHYFAALDDLLKPGPTDTNVNDITFLFGHLAHDH